jgi:toxin-antitoxin system PIN domain toxin
MIAVDTNILVYALRSEMPQHGGARAALDGLASEGIPWAIPWPCVHEFLGVTTNPGVFKIPTPVDVAVGAVEDMVAGGNLVFLAEAGDHLVRLKGLLRSGRIAGPAVHDAKVAAICISHGVSELWSADRDFSRFPGLTVRNPLASRL